MARNRSILILAIYLLIFNIVLTHGVNIKRREASGAQNKTNEDSEDEEDEDFDDEDDVFDDDGRVYKNPRNSPSLLCPRDEEQATLLGQKCLRKCSTDEDCKSKKKKCLCDGHCGMSCIKPDRECDDLISPELGVVTLTGRMFGDKATYSCDHGFHLVGLKERVCRADGSWSGQSPACKQNIYCTSPPVIQNARHNAQLEQTTFDLDTSLQYQCYNGYVTNGFPRAKCLSIDGRASWFGPDITCEPRSCGPPMDISHGWHTGECYTLSCRVAYQCAEGYELVGRSERYCQPDGTWSPRELPSCVPVECSPPENPANGKAIYTSISYNSVVSYECKYGFTLSGLQTRRCGADKKWTGLIPQCKEINCGHPGFLANGWLENAEAGSGLGAVIIFRCHDHMKMIGNASTVCQIDGRWRYPLPACLAPCVVPKIQHGRTVILESTNETVAEFPLVVAHDERLSIDCEENYEMALNNTPVKCVNGTWSHIPACVPARCKTLPKPPKNGIVIAPKTEHGMKARFDCRDGYTLRGSNVTECSFGNWTGELPHCQQVYCPFPGVIEHGRVMLVGNMGLYDYRPYVRKVTNNKQIMYECDKGYALTDGPPGATCIGGQWSPQNLPRCEPGLHPRLRWQRSLASKKKYMLRKLRELKKSKRKNFKYINEIKIKQIKYVGDHPELKRQKRYAAAETDDESNEDGNSDEDDEDEDEEDEDEEEEEEIHEVEDKKTKTKSKRALLMGHQTQQRQQMINRRKDGGRDSKKKNRGGVGGSLGEDDEEDEKGGESNNKVKAGRGKVPCEELRNEPHFSVSIVKFGKDPNTTNSPGTIVQVTCSPGYGLNIVNSTARCARGEWKPARPVCEVLPCELPASEHALYREIDNHQYLDPSAEVLSGQTVEFSCRRGYNIQGPATLRCWLGQWDINALPECHPLPCELPNIEHGSYLLGYRAGLTIGNGSSVQFTCDEHFTKSTKEGIDCILGTLIPGAPACRTRGEETWFKGGSDITVDGGLIPLEGEKRACAPPARVQGSLIYKDGEPMRESDRSFPDGTEVRFHCVGSMLGERTTWRIVCEDGSWVGRSSACDLDAHLAYAHERNSSCAFRNSEPNVVSFFNDQLITEEVVDFPSGTVLVSRCTDIGKYAFNGVSVRRCVNGRWNASRPVCFGLNQENDYALEKPPTILFRHQLGPIAQSNDGKLIVFPGTILHMECLWIRRFGTPKWNVSHEYRKYPEGWSTDPGRDSQLEYRLSIMHAAKDDSGVFTCITPTRHTHAVEVVVQAVHCQPLPQRRGLTISSQNTKMNAKVVLSCSNGNALIGSHELTCLPSGNWSSSMPVCQSIECADLNLTDGNLRVSVLSREVGGRAMFSCGPGYGLIGSSEATCLPSGDWSGPLPICQEVTCADPGAPENGYVQGVGPYTAGAVVQFNCNPDFMMKGQPIIACQETGRWSGALPKCVQACSYPGTTIKGRMSAVKFYYQIGENITFSCDEGLVLRGAAMLKCLKSGKWSNAIPTCILPSTTTEDSSTP